jgi:two-component system cell cycle response regulator
MKLLIAEDDLTSRTILTAVVSKWGYEPIAVEDGSAALQIMQAENPPRILLVDWEMPEISGLALCKEIREQESSDPPYIVLLTSRNSTDDIVAGLESGANDYICKPFQNAELNARLQVGKRMLGLQQELNNAKEEMAFQASHDALTGLFNRRAVMAAMEREIERTKRNAQPLYICMCDIDHFKSINDTYGHLAGDAVIKEVANRFNATLRPYDLVGRYGGEEFLILVNSDESHVEDLFERIRKAIATEAFVYEQTPIQVTISCGVTKYAPPTDNRDETALLAAADAELYKAKESGRNKTIISQES